MFGTWFKPGDKSANVTGPQSTASEASPNPSQPHLESRPSINHGVTTATSTPHDAVLAELISQRPDIDSNARINEIPETSSLRDEDLTTESHQRARSPNREPVYDPFTGSNIIGLALPDDREQDGVDFESTKDELWAHMAHIREVQSQIANMHVVMEGIGLGPQGEQGTTGRSVPLVNPSEGGGWEEGEDSEDEDAEEKKARESEFSKLAEKFNGRREANDNIMRKLDELSQVVTAFHALRTPAVDFSGSRSNTKDETPSPATGPSRGQSGITDPPTVVIPPMRKKESHLAFIESPVSININNPLPDVHGLASKFPTSR